MEIDEAKKKLDDIQKKLELRKTNQRERKKL